MPEFFSPSWYRVSSLKPRLRTHIRLHRHQYRGQVWYVLQDFVSDRFHRFPPPVYFVIGLMDGCRTVHQIWEMAMARLGDDAPTQQEIITLISQLHAIDGLVITGMAPDTAELTRRSAQQTRRERMSKLMNVFAWRFPLCDPDRFLTRFLPLVRPFLGPVAAVTWLVVVSIALVIGVTHWTDVSQDFLDQAMAPQNLFLLWLLFPVIKLLHELGHAFVTKAFGGEVHELGVMLLVFTPVPYVEASAAWAFENKWKRVLVGAAGMIVELFVASLALFLWVSAEPGLMRMAAYNVILIAGVSTVLFNANPLLRFDGYYMLMDFLEIPNLKGRATRYFSWLYERYVLVQREAEMPVSTPGERVWFVAYSLASSVYRVLVVVGILLFLGDRFPLAAVLFAAMTAIAMIGVPVVKGVKFLFTNPRLQRIRVRAVMTTAMLAAAIALTFSVVPVPFHTLAEGVVWLPDEAYVRAGTNGFVKEVVVKPGTMVQAGEVLLICENVELATQLDVAEQRLLELEARRTEQLPTDLVKAAILEEEILYATQERARARERADQLTVRSRRGGTFVSPVAVDLPGRFVHQGELLAHVVDLDTITVRAVVGQGEIDLVRHDVDHVEVRLAEGLPTAIGAVLHRIVPAASTQLPSAALGSEGGGTVPMDPSDREGATAMQRVFEVDLILGSDVHVVNAGGRVYVRFAHPWRPFSSQWSRQIRQLFLSRFNV